jgi:hypothetical protein
MKKVAGLFIFFGLTANLLMWPLMVLAQSDDPTPTDPPRTDTPVLNPTDTPPPTDTPTPTALPSDFPTDTPIPTDTPTPTDTPVLQPVADNTTLIVVVDQATPTPVLTINNDPDVSNNANANAGTGNNSITTTLNQNDPPASPTPTPVAVIGTGNAVALANIVNIANVNNVGSNVKIYLVNNADGQVEPIDLNSAWNLLDSNPNINMLTVDTSGNNVVSINNYGSISNSVTATAVSGNNQITGNNGIITTGDAYALANVFNLLNLNVFNSRVFFGVMNVNGQNLGDLILPNPSDFNNGSGDGFLPGNVTDTASISNISTALASSGNDSISSGDNNTIITGSAVAWTQSLNIANMTLNGSNNLVLDINTLGDWTGQIYNWQAPGTVTNGGISNLFMTGGGGETATEGGSINNVATIGNYLLAISLTGGNGINGSNDAITTGNAYAGAMATNLDNINLLNSKWFLGVINVVGDWNGNVIFAYPDLTMSMTLSNDKPNVGDETDITVNYANIGYDDSGSDTVEVDLPNNLQYLSDNSGTVPSVNGGKLIWQFGNMPAKTSKSFTVRARLNNDQTAWFLVQPVMAADSSETINGNVSTTRTEVTTDNNNATATVYLDANDNSTKLWPKLTISEKNNVNNWVYKNDVVTFEIDGKNEGEATAYNSYLDQKILDSKGNVLAENKMDIGTIDINQAGTITFGVPITFNIRKDEILTSQTQLIGYTQNNDEVQSNMTSSSFLVKTGITEKTVVGVVKATNENLGVLGAATTQPIIDLLPYVLLFIMSTFWILKQSKKWLAKK